MVTRQSSENLNKHYALRLKIFLQETMRSEPLQQKSGYGSSQGPFSSPFTSEGRLGMYLKPLLIFRLRIIWLKSSNKTGSLLDFLILEG